MSHFWSQCRLSVPGEAPWSGRTTVDQGRRTICGGRAHFETILGKQLPEVIAPMPENDPATTQRAPIVDVAESAIVRALHDAGFTGAEEIGRGGFGVVYRCRQESLDRDVAVKVLRWAPQPADLERFLREQRAMGRLSGHPHIVTVLHAGATDDLPYLVMHYHPHDSLDTRLRRYGVLSWPEAVRLGVRMAGALETAHRSDVLHRDVKPGNILLTEYGEPQLTDFGIARIGDGFRTTAGEITGSPAFTAPEVLRGRAPTPAADVYGLAATLFAAITGHAAFERKECERVVAQFVRITSEPIPDLRDDGIPDDVCAALESGMATDPDDRPQTAAAFGEILRNIQRAHGLPVDEMALPGPPPTSPPQTPADLPVTGPSSGVLSGPTGPTVAPSTRFRPPSTTRPLVERRRLISLLQAGRRRRLIAIHAPTGFGKSTLAAQWRDVLADEGAQVAWLTVDDDDDNVLWFLAHLIEAMKQVRPSLARELAQILDVHGNDAERYVLSTLIDDLHRSDTAATLFVDDWHRVSSPETCAALDFLLDRGCHHLQLVVTSRNRSGLPLSRMRVRDELVELDSTALRFDVDESDSFLRGVSGIDLGPEDVQDLNRSTEGWVAALQLASLSLRDSDDPSWMIENITGRHHAIGEFLADNVLSTLEPRMYEFLLATCITESVSGSLAAALTGDPRSQAVLEEAEERDLFLRHLDDERVWFRYHHMFLDFLRRRLERDHPEKIAGLHRTAADWFARHHMLREAVDHAMEAGDTDFAVDLLAADGMYLMEHGHIAPLLALIDTLPPQAVAREPRLLLAQAWANSALQRLSLARSALATVRDLVDSGVTAGQDPYALRLEADAVEASLLMNSDRIDGIDALVAPCLDDPSAVHPWVVSAAADFASYADIFRFDFDSAVRRQEWAAPFHRETRGPFAAIYGQCLCGIAVNEQLDVEGAEKYFRTALRRARRHGGIHTHSGRLAAAMLGELLYEQGRTAEAETLLDESNLLGIDGGATDFMIARFATAARMKMMHGDRKSATALLDEGLRAAALNDLPRLRARLENERVRLGLGAVPTPTRTMPGSDRPNPDGTVEIRLQLEDATAIRLLCESDESGAAERAVDWAQLWVRRTADLRPRAHLQAIRLLVCCLNADGRTQEAERTLAMVAAECASRGMVRYLVDGGPRATRTLGALHRRMQEDRWPDDWARVDAQFLERAVRLAEDEDRPVV
ncbi:serine/threonine-protein kinase [Rhodococcus gordoniae]|uniref:non-specific serine/threonine protein kinase n=3 Tax=Rhodococcus TaxID=1827 RepID=A0A379M665_9NOCA|nr:serine/threonine-protein kinase [Rhodococcus gordoniae]